MDLSTVLDEHELTAFYASFECGDVATLAGFFVRDAVRSVVHNTNDYVIAHAPQDDVFVTPPDAATAPPSVGGRPPPPRYFYPWYYTKPPRGVLAPHKFLIGVAIENGHWALLAWLFAPHHQLLMGATLAVALPLAARLAINTSDVAILELLLTSQVFCHCLSDMRRQDALDAMLAQVRVTGSSDDVVRLVIAHGARVDQDEQDNEYATAMITTGAWSGDVRRAKLMVAHGAFATGDTVRVWASSRQGSI